jgi:hypothetical protein
MRIAQAGEALIHVFLGFLAALKLRDVLLGIASGCADLWLLLKLIPWFGGLIAPRLWIVTSRIRSGFPRDFVFAVTYALGAGGPPCVVFGLIYRFTRKLLAIDRLTFRNSFFSAFCAAGLLLLSYDDRHRKTRATASPPNEERTENPD